MTATEPTVQVTDTAAATESTAQVTDTKSASGGKRIRHKGLDAMKFWLMPFICFASFGFYAPFGDLVARLSLFASIAFYILCGYTAALNRQQKDFHKRVIKRTAIHFAILVGVFLILNAALYLSQGLLQPVIAETLRKRTLFNFVVLCLWPYPIGETLWFLQALLYARIILWLMDKWKLMRFYKAVMVITLLGMILLGELAGVIGFSFHGYTYIPGNGLTRALPYMLVGWFLFEKKDKLVKVPSWLWIVLLVLGIGAAMGEWVLLARTGYLVYTGHFVGYGIMAISACGLVLKKEDKKSNFAVAHGPHYAWRIYYLSQPVGHALLLITFYLLPWYYGVTRALLGLLVYLVCLLIAFIIGKLKNTKRTKKARDERFSLWLFIKRTFKKRSQKRRARKYQWTESKKGKFSLRLWLKQTFRRRSHKNQWRESPDERFSLRRYIKHTFRHHARKRRARQYQWRESRSHRHHSHGHHSHGHHSHGHHSYEHRSDGQESKNTDKPE